MKKLKAALKKAWLRFKAKKFARFIKNYFGLDDAIALFFGIIGALFYVKGPIPYHEGLHNFYERIHIDLMVLSATVLIIGNANQYNQLQAEKRNLIIQMGGSDNGIARGAVDQLQERGWLTDGFLKGARLSRANLKGADLRQANLGRATLSEAHLEEAELDLANLEEARLILAHLEGANLWKVHLEGADMRLAHLEGANMTEATYNNETQWMSAKYTKDYKETKWPHEGFDPEAEGCILVEENVEIEIPKAKKK